MMRRILGPVTACITGATILYFAGMAAFPAYWQRSAAGFPPAQWKIYWFLYRPAFEHQPGRVLWNYVEHTSGMSDLEMFLFVNSILSDRPTSPAEMWEEFDFIIND